MSGALEFFGEKEINIRDGADIVKKFRLPSIWADDDFNATTFIYERIELSQNEHIVTVYYNIYPDNKIDGTLHKTDKSKRLMRCTKDGYLMVPLDLESDIDKSKTDVLYLNGKGSYFEIRFSKPIGTEKFIQDMDEESAKFTSLFNKRS